MDESPEELRFVPIPVIVMVLFASLSAVSATLPAHQIPVGLQPYDYYVSPGGVDGNPGTRAEPWQTVARVNQESFFAGDRIFFEGGETRERRAVPSRWVLSERAGP
ncbi:hypothetical protein ACFLU6_07215 [Acidobacteriota bacterium]